MFSNRVLDNLIRVIYKYHEFWMMITREGKGDALIASWCDGAGEREVGQVKGNKEGSVMKVNGGWKGGKIELKGWKSKTK